MIYSYEKRDECIKILTDKLPVMRTGIHISQAMIAYFSENSKTKKHLIALDLTDSE